jgi:hemoglobin-like flavoprotein
MSSNELFDLSYARLFGEGVGIAEDATPFFATFYRHFLEDPDIADSFSQTDMSRQVAMLRKSFFHLVAFYVSHEPSAELERIANVHHQIGIDPGFYDLWLDALVEAVRELDPECDLATELAWRWAMTPGLTYMRLLDRLSEPRPANQQ